jgi:hypothetical protein
MLFAISLLVALAASVLVGWDTIQKQKGKDGIVLTALGYTLTVVGGLCFLKLASLFLLAFATPPARPWYHFW